MADMISCAQFIALDVLHVQVLLMQIIKWQAWGQCWQPSGS